MANAEIRSSEPSLMSKKCSASVAGNLISCLVLGYFGTPSTLCLASYKVVYTDESQESSL